MPMLIKSPCKIQWNSEIAENIGNYECEMIERIGQCYDRGCSAGHTHYHEVNSYLKFFFHYNKIYKKTSSEIMFHVIVHKSCISQSLRNSICL